MDQRPFLRVSFRIAHHRSTFHYLVGPPQRPLKTNWRANCSPFEWQEGKGRGVEVKPTLANASFNVLARSTDRGKERAMASAAHSKKLWARLKELQQMGAVIAIHYLLKLGARPRANIHRAGALVKKRSAKTESFAFCLPQGTNSTRGFVAGKGRYLLRSNVGSEIPLNVGISMSCSPDREAFKNLKGDLRRLRPHLSLHSLTIKANRKPIFFFGSFPAFSFTQLWPSQTALRAPGSLRYRFGHSSAIQCSRPIPNH